MSRYRLKPTPAQEVILRRHCTHARYVWNLAVEQQSWWRPGRSYAPGYCAQATQLTQARAAFDWLAAGSQPMPAPGTGQIVGIDRGVTVSAALSTGVLLHCPTLRPAERVRLRLLQRKLARAQKGSPSMLT